jgi:hypothetical protein
MPGYVLHAGATVLCAHGGQAQPSVASPRVTVSGMPVATQAAPHSIAGCPFTVPPPSPCVTATWTVAALRVTSLGAPILVQSSQAVCAPNGTPVSIVALQTRVSAI